MSKPIRRPIVGPKRSIVGNPAAARKPVTGSRAGTNARPADEGYLYVAGVRDASQRVSEYRVGPPYLLCSFTCARRPAHETGRERRLSRLSNGSTIQQEPEITSLAMLSQDVRPPTLSMWKLIRQV
jgi:hypothetical protein